MNLTRRLLPASVLLLPAVVLAADPPPPAKEKADVGGYKLSYSVQGTGRPTVVIEPGAGLPGAASKEWEAVAAEVAKTCRVVRYDRAGLGASDAPPKTPRTSREAAKDLRALLTAANAPGPYVLVGHSIGGFHVRAFADLYPDDVAGVVLVDAAHPDQDAEWLAALGQKTDGEPPAVGKAREFLAGRLKDRGRNPESLDMVASREQVRAAKPLGAKPLAVLTHSPKWKMVPDLPDEVLAKIERVSQDLQAGYKGLSSDSTHTVAKTAGHAIHLDEPDLVVKAIREVIGKVEAGGGKK